VAKSKSSEHGKRYPVNWIAAEFGVGRTLLARRLSYSGKGPFTIKQALEAWTSKTDREANLNRRAMAEAENAELDAMRKRGDVRKELERMTADHAIRVRTEVESADFLNADQRKKLSKAIAAIELPKSLI
jgi:seryl-tRNA(Sec) selenium transferase